MVIKKRFKIIFDFLDVPKKIKSIEKLLKIVHSIGYNSIIFEIRLGTQKVESKKQMEDFFALINNFKSVYSMQFKTTIHFHMGTLNKKLLRLFARKNIGLILLMDSYSDVVKSIKKLLIPYKRKLHLVQCLIDFRRGYCFSDVCNEFKGENIPFDIVAFEPESIAQLFYKWFLDNSMVNFVYFSDCLKSVLLDLDIDICKHSSCLGRTLYMNDAGDLSFCPNRDKLTVLGNIETVESYIDIFENDTFSDILKKSKHSRDKCKNECVYFSKCQGGCPMNQYDEGYCDHEYCQEKKFLLLLRHIEELLRNCFANNISLNKINPLAKQDILNAIAFDSNVKRFMP